MHRRDTYLREHRRQRLAETGDHVKPRAKERPTNIRVLLTLDAVVVFILVSNAAFNATTAEMKRTHTC